MKVLIIALTALVSLGNAVASSPEFAPANMFATASTTAAVQPDGKEVKFLNKDWVNNTQKTCVITSLDKGEGRSKVGCAELGSVFVNLKEMPSGPITLIQVRDKNNKEKVKIK